MAKSRSVLKKIRQNRRRRARNMGAKSAMRTAIKKVEAAIAQGDKEAAQVALRSAIRQIDETASKGILHRNTASRKVSRLMRKVHTLELQA